MAGRRTFSDAEKHRIVDEGSQPGVTLSQVALRYRFDRRVLFRWKEALRAKERKAEPSCPVFAPAQIMDAASVAEAPESTGTRPRSGGVQRLLESQSPMRPRGLHPAVRRTDQSPWGGLANHDDLVSIVSM